MCTRGPRLRHLLIAAFAATLLCLLPAARGEDTVARLVEELSEARSFKVRVQAANLLVQLDDPRVMPALLHALRTDRDYVVREAAAGILSGVAAVRPASRAVIQSALAQAARDPSPKVRRAAKRGLTALLASPPPSVRTQPAVGATPTAAVAMAPQPARSTRMKILVGKFADRSGAASPHLREQVRRQVMQRLQTQRQVTVVEKLEPDVAFVLEGSIKALSLSVVRGDVDATCAVELVLSRATRGIVLAASGEATVQRLKAQFRPQQRAALEEEAMVHAVRSAHDNLAAFLARQ